MSKKSKYPNGYIGKINYWSGKVLTATTTAEKEKAMSSLNYFMAKEQSLDAPKKPKKKLEKLDLGNGNIVYGW